MTASGEGDKTLDTAYPALDAESQLNEAGEDHFYLRLYVAGQTPKSVRAYENLKKICHEHLEGRYHIDVIDLMKNPQLAKGDEIVAIPTLVRQLPHPIRKIIGDLSNTDRTLVGLQIKPQ